MTISTKRSYHIGIRMCVISHRRPEAPSASDTRRFSTRRVVSVLPRVHCPPGTVLSYCWWAFFIPGHHGRPSNEHFYHQEVGVKSPLCCSELSRPLLALFPLHSLIWPSGWKDQVSARPPGSSPTAHLLPRVTCGSGEVMDECGRGNSQLFPQMDPSGVGMSLPQSVGPGRRNSSRYWPWFLHKIENLPETLLVTVPVSWLQEIKGNWPSVYNIWIQHNLTGDGFGNIVLTINLKNTVFKSIFFVYGTMWICYAPWPSIDLFHMHLFNTYALFNRCYQARVCIYASTLLWKTLTFGQQSFQYIETRKKISKNVLFLLFYTSMVFGTNGNDL